LILPAAARNSVPGGSALAVDRDLFAADVTSSLLAHPMVTVAREEFTPADADAVLAAGDQLVLATGPLTSPDLAAWLAAKT
ncbi:methylenetetrahydrofolate--tRNA-(uracil(54)-C(5))-methyltransferase (FADH(2)-oxidizing) TrmFO, partial [Acinetobacter baumannii]